MVSQESVLGYQGTLVSLRLPRNWVCLRLKRYSGQPKATLNWGQPYIKEELWSVFVQYKCTEASFQLSALEAVGLVLCSVIFANGLAAINNSVHSVG
jgi:hypothetical protein